MPNYYCILLIVFFSCSKILPPSGMVYIEGGELTRGSDRGKFMDQYPRNTVRVSSFYIDSTLVTIQDYKKFTVETNYITESQKIGYCQIAREGMKDWKWILVLGADFEHPYGKDSPLPISPLLPAVCVSVPDAMEYCTYQKKRLPTEAEWEFAMRAGSKSRFPWGDHTVSKGKYLLNFWQGTSHENAEQKDGFVYLSPVNAFPPNQNGIYDPVGNVWQMTKDFYSVSTYSNSKKIFSESGSFELNPQGPPSGYSYVTRGGSWWCSEKTCNGYGLNYRGHVSPNAVFNNNGFRCVKDIN